MAMLENIKKYFNKTPYEDILRDWENVVEECSSIESPLVSDFIEQNFNYHFKIPDNWYVQSKQSLKEENLNPSSSSDFFIFDC
jgi:hypothetical protein